MCLIRRLYVFLVVGSSGTADLLLAYLVDKVLRVVSGLNIGISDKLLS